MTVFQLAGITTSLLYTNVQWEVHKGPVFGSQWIPCNCVPVRQSRKKTLSDTTLANCEHVAKLLQAQQCSMVTTWCRREHKCTVPDSAVRDTEEVRRPCPLTPLHAAGCKINAYSDQAVRCQVVQLLGVNGVLTQLVAYSLVPYPLLHSTYLYIHFVLVVVWVE